jgi:hypothetical protein
MVERPFAVSLKLIIRGISTLYYLESLPFIDTSKQTLLEDFLANIRICSWFIGSANGVSRIADNILLYIVILIDLKSCIVIDWTKSICSN